jgi:hypothetical protein
VNTIKTAKKNEKIIHRLTNLKSIHTRKESKSAVVYFQKNHSQINQTNSTGTTTVYKKNQILENNTQNLPFGKVTLQMSAHIDCSN